MGCFGVAAVLAGCFWLLSHSTNPPEQGAKDEKVTCEQCFPQKTHGKDECVLPSIRQIAQQAPAQLSQGR